MNAPLLLARDHEGQLQSGRTTGRQPGRPTGRARLIYGIIFEEIIFYVKLVGVCTCVEHIGRVRSLTGGSVSCAGMGYLARHKRYHVRSIA